jgi:predicted transcriptional regulator
LNSGFKTKSEEIEWRRAKILELKSQGLDQREIAQVLQVSPTTITFDLQYLRKEARENVQDYTTRELPLQFRVAIKATWNAIKEYWNISQKAEDNREKMQALEQYLKCHVELCSMLGVENALKSFDTVEDKQQLHQYKEGELVFPKGYALYVYHSNEYIRHKNMEDLESGKNAFVGPEKDEQEP